MAKILVCDDETNIADMVGDWLIQQKHDVTVVYSGTDCWKNIQGNDFDLAIMDWDLPDAKGVDILKRFRDAGGSTPVIMLTGHKTVDDKGIGFDAGADDYMTKPFHMKELGSRIGAVLRRSSAPPAPPKALGTGNEKVLEQANLLGTAIAARYEILDVIGKGEFAIVCKARHPQLDKLFAIKILHSGLKQEEIVARFEREARAISRLEHRNVITVNDYGMTERGLPFMVMEFVDGKSLREMISESEYVPLEVAVDILTQVADGLTHAHDKGILHRDVKPSNVMIKHSEENLLIPKLVDFGLARFKDTTAKGAADDSDWQAKGSAPYMSPEQINCKPLDERSDIYSFGCAAFHTLTGYWPHIGDNEAETLTNHLNEPPHTFEEVRPELTFPNDLKLLVGQMLEKDPDRRPQSMREVAERLRALK